MTATTPTALVAFLNEAARYFERRDTHGEDSAFWANAVNAENCRKAAAMITEQVTDATRLQLMWLASPALPVGGFSYSEGLEAAIDQGLVSNEASASAWLRDQLLLSLARADLAVLARAVPA